MTINKITIAHIVSEILVVSAVAFYFHKKYVALQTQVQELVNKIEKLNLERVSVLCQKQEQFETQTTQQINKIWSILNQQPMYQQPMYQRSEYQRPVFVPQFDIDSSDKEPVREKYRGNENKKEEIKTETVKPKEKTSFNPLQSAMSMIGPLSTMFQLATDRKTPHPSEVFQNVNIEAVIHNQPTQSSAKIVEIEDEQVDVVANEIAEKDLDKELEQELQELCTPMISPNRFDTRSAQRFNDSISIVTVTKSSSQLPYQSPHREELQELQSTDDSNDQVETTSSQNSSPIRFISASEAKKPGRKKRVQAKTD
jgi:hypothetical protein